METDTKRGWKGPGPGPGLGPPPPSVAAFVHLGDSIINSRRIVSRLEMLKHNSLHDSNPRRAGEGYVVRTVSGRVISFATPQPPQRTGGLPISDSGPAGQAIISSSCVRARGGARG